MACPEPGCAGPLEPCDGSGDEWWCLTCRRHFLIDDLDGRVLLVCQPAPLCDVNGVRMPDP